MSANKLVVADGHEWIQRAGQLWGTYETCAAYLGICRASLTNYVWRHNLRTIRHGRKALINKLELDRASGAIAA